MGCTSGPYKVTDKHKVRRLPDELPFGLKPFKSSTHVALCREAVNYIMNSNISKTLLNLLQHYPFAEESFFAILEHNQNANFPCSRHQFQPESHNSSQKIFGLNSVKFAPRYKQWAGFNKSKCPSKNLQREICMIGVKTLPEIVNKSYGRALAVNKFPWTFEPMAWDCMMTWHHNRKVQELKTGTIDPKFYQNWRNASKT